MVEKRKSSDPIPESNKKTKSEPAVTDAASTTSIPADHIPPVSPPENAPCTGAVEPAAVLKKFKSLPLPSPLTGKFDLYQTQLPFFQSEYLPEGAIEPDFRAVYNVILFYQKKPDFTLRCAMRTNPTGQSVGHLRSSTVKSPLSMEPLESIHIIEGQTKDCVKFDEAESAHPSTVGEGIGYEAKLDLDTNGDLSIYGLITSGTGVFKMRKVWEDQSMGRELFEGYWRFEVVYANALSRAGRGGSTSHGHTFWAVRALKKQGEEVGIDAGNGNYVPSPPESYDSFPGLDGLRGGLSTDPHGLDYALKGLTSIGGHSGSLPGVGGRLGLPDAMSIDDILRHDNPLLDLVNSGALDPKGFPGGSLKGLSAGDLGDLGSDRFGHMGLDGPLDANGLPPSVIDSLVDFDNASKNFDGLIAKLDGLRAHIHALRHAEQNFGKTTGADGPNPQSEEPKGSDLPRDPGLGRFGVGDLHQTLGGSDARLEGLKDDSLGGGKTIALMDEMENSGNPALDAEIRALEASLGITAGSSRGGVPDGKTTGLHPTSGHMLDGVIDSNMDTLLGGMKDGGLGVDYTRALMGKIKSDDGPRPDAHLSIPTETDIDAQIAALGHLDGGDFLDDGEFEALLDGMNGDSDDFNFAERMEKLDEDGGLVARLGQLDPSALEALTEGLRDPNFGPKHLNGMLRQMENLTAPEAQK